MFNKFSFALIFIVIFIEFDTNHYQILSDFVPRIAPSCNIQTVNGTTRQLKDIFIGRCYYYSNVLQGRNCYFNSSGYNCDAIWDQFSKTVLNKTCEIKDYSRLLDLVDHYIPENRSLFWSGTYTSAHQYTKTHQYWSLEDTFAGYLLDDLVFCINANQFDYTNPSCNSDCQYRTFWNAASKRFAEKAQGNIKVVLNGTRTTGAITNTSTFFLQELPNFKNITKLTVLLLHTPSLKKIETCASGASLKDLAIRLRNMSIEYECNDNPKDILFYLCFEDQSSKECQSAKFSLDSGVSLYANKLLLVLLIQILPLFIYY